VLRLKNLVSLAVAAAALTATSHAGVITVPPGLSVGSQFRLAFVTADTTNGNSTDIATYNSFVSNEANMNALLASISWSAIGTTDTVNAISNIGADTGIPVYNLGGNLVVTTTALLFNGLSTAYSHPINVNQFGNTVDPNTTVWTGTGDGGIKPPGSTNALGDLTPNIGTASSTGFGAYAAGNSFHTNNWGMYAISAVLTVPAAVPEPGSMCLIALGGIALVAARGKFRARQR
jgi:hypothetical protein